MVDSSEYLGLFLDESREHLQELNASLLDLERDPSSEEAIASIFRAAHTLKGMSATMGFEGMARLTHRMEEILGLFRDAERPVTGDTVDVLFACLDAIESMVDDIGEGGAGQTDTDQLLVRLASAESGDVPAAALARLAATVAPAPVSSDPEASGGAPGDASAEDGPADVSKHVTGSIPSVSPADASTGRVEGSGVPGRCSPRKAASTVRVGTDKLDDLMNLMGEMVIQRTRLARAAGQDARGELGAAIDDLGRVADDIQTLIMQMRMTSVDVVFQRFPRMVRDLGNSLDKRIELLIAGEDTEIDRTVIDELGDPLVHLLRNAVDHGIESPAEREAAGKDPVGVIRLAAQHNGDSVEITVSDDGRGIDPDSLRRAAVSEGLIRQDEADALSDQEAIELIFRSGFSTAAETTDVSGRGVGMDAVRSQTLGLSGDVLIDSIPGQGTTFTIRLPLALATIRALLVRSGRQVYALPLDSVEETIVLHGDDARTINGQECMVLRDHVVPLVALRGRLDLGAGEDHVEQLNVVVVRSGDSRLGVVVGDLVGQQDIVIKHLPRHLGDADGVAGATLLGDGSMALIIDARGLKGPGKGVRHD